MVVFSVPDAAVVWLRPAPPKKGTRLLLWPAWAWHVSAPGKVPQPLDLFALHTLRLAALGIVHPERIADHLKLDAELIRRVLLELAQSGHVTHDGTPTDRGRALLQGLDDEVQFRDGYVFQDAVTPAGSLGPTLFPYFADALVELLRDVRIVASGRPRIDVRVGTTGAGARLKTFYVEPVPSGTTPPMPPRPRPATVVDACARARRLSRDGATLLTTLASQVVYLGREPAPVWLALEVRGEASKARRPLGDEPMWRVEDPFGQGRDEVFRDMVTTWAKAHDGAARGLVDVLFDPAEGDCASQAWQAVLQRYGLGHEREPWFRAVAEMERLRKREADVRHATKELRLALELFLGSRVRAGSEVWRRMFAGDRPLDKRTTCEVVRQAAVRLGCQGLPPRTFEVHPHDLRRVFTDGGAMSFRVRATIAALVLQADDDPRDPLVRALSRDPSLLGDAVKLTDVGNKAVHEFASAPERAFERLHQIIHRVLDEV